MSMFYPVNSLFEVNNEAYERFIKYLNKKRKIPLKVIQVIRFLIENKYKTSDDIFHRALKK